MSDIVNDLYTLKRGKWTLHEEYASRDLGRAITEAKNLIKANDIDAVGIIREGTDSRTGELREKLAYGDAKISGVPFLNDHEILPMADQITRPRKALISTKTKKTSNKKSPSADLYMISRHLLPMSFNAALLPCRSNFLPLPLFP